MNSVLSSVRFACTALAGTNKVGLLKPDEEGYYTTVIGGLGMYNSAGDFYDAKEARALFDASSALKRRISRGACRGEYGHPKQMPGMTDQQFARRLLAIWEENVCVHFKEIWLDNESVCDDNGKPVIAIMGKFIPSGPKGPFVEKSLKNKNENICFSIRSFTCDNYDPSIMANRKVIKNIVTFDFVNEPGIAIANKYKSPTLESLEDRLFTRGTMDSSIQEVKNQGMESSILLTADELYESLGWTMRSSVKHNTPVYDRWN